MNDNDNLYDELIDYSIWMLCRTGNKVRAVKALREAGQEHGITLTAAHRTLSAIDPSSDPMRNSFLILRAVNTMRDMDKERQDRIRDDQLLLALKDAISAVPASGFEYDEHGHYMGKTCTDEDYATLGRNVVTIFSHYMNN